MKGTVCISAETLDPTRAPALQALKARVLADQRVTAFLNETQSKRLALVLSGGGGKGAYEAGVLLALYDCGLTRFCSLAGTSVGALNAALFHEVCRTGSRDLILQTWCEVAFSKVLKLSATSLLMMAFYVLCSARMLTSLKEIPSLVDVADISRVTLLEVLRALILASCVLIIPVVVGGLYLWYGVGFLIHIGVDNTTAVYLLVMLPMCLGLIAIVLRFVGVELFLFSNAPHASPHQATSRARCGST